MKGTDIFVRVFFSILILNSVVDHDCYPEPLHPELRNTKSRNGLYQYLNRYPKFGDGITPTPPPVSPWARGHLLDAPVGSAITQSRRHKQHYWRIHDSAPLPYKNFIDYIRKNFKNKGKWEFNIYNEKQMNETVTLIEMFKHITLEHDFDFTEFWAQDNMNFDMYDYAMRLVLTYKPTPKFYMEPPYLTRPNFYINGETISKVYQIIKRYYKYTYEDRLYKKMYTTPRGVIINTNYSGWQLENKNCFGYNYDSGIKYFTEDLELNSYYYGLNLLYPYWMTNGDLEEIDIRYAEHYYFVHKQLLARYYLEMEQFAQRNITFENGASKNFNPYLVNEKELFFTTRYINGSLLHERPYRKLNQIIKSVARHVGDGEVILNGQRIEITEQNHMDLIPRYLRDSFDGPTNAPVVRSVLCNCSHTDYIAPSVFVHPSTTLRDPYYWYMIGKVLDVIPRYQKKFLQPLDLSNYETEDYRIVNFTHSKLQTDFEYFRVLLVRSKRELVERHEDIYARLKRRVSKDFDFNFTVESKHKGLSIVRIFLGPQCSNEGCWNVRDKFFQLDAFKYYMTQGINNVSWCPHRNIYSSDAFFNQEHYFSEKFSKHDYSMFLFPKRLILPKGLINGLDSVIFVMITRDDNYIHARQIGVNDYIVYVDKKPLGFPFHRDVKNFNFNATNYKFYNVSIFQCVQKRDEFLNFNVY